MKLPIKPTFLTSFLVAGISFVMPNRATAQTFTSLHTFSPLSSSSSNSDGSNPNDTLIVSGNTLYGTATDGGTSGNGTVFSMNTDGTGYTVLHNFSPYNPSGEFASHINSDGAHPIAGLILSGNTLYGTAISGGTAGEGTVFSINANGTGFATVYSFTNGNDGSGDFPHGGLTLSGNILYGTASYGGVAGNGGSGTVFSVNINGTGFKPLYTFTNGTDGQIPNGGVILVGDALYGTAYSGGDSSNGTVFSVTTDGATFSVVHAFSGFDKKGNNSDGALPFDGLILSGNVLYGTASEGGSAGEGTVFSVNTDGTSFTTLHSFTAAQFFFNGDGEIPLGGLALSGDTLYGMAKLGGKYGFGTVFSVSTSGTDFKNLYSLGIHGGTNGAWPLGGVVLSDNVLYGTTSIGGSANNGIVFSLSIGPSTVQQGSLEVTITPAAAVEAGAKWQLDGETTNDSGATVTDLSVGDHTVSFLPAPGWTTPASKTVAVNNGATTRVSGVYEALPPNSAPLVLRTNGEGTIQHVAWPPELVIGKKYTVTAVPVAGNLFSDWVGGTSMPYSVLSTSTAYTFTMQSNLVLRANFAANPFIPAHGTFSGLYMDTNDVMEASSGFFTLNLTTTGAFTGKIMTSGSTYSLPTTNKFDVGGQVQFTIATKQGILTFILVLGPDEPTGQQITGTVSDGVWTAGLTADRAVFSATTNKAVNFEGQYTFSIARGVDAAARPGGDGWGTLSFNSAGLITIYGNLADGTPISQSAVSVSQDGRWPFYAAYMLPPAGNGGAVFSWITFSNQPASTLGGTMYWFRPVGKTPATYQSGFTNKPAITGSAYNPTDKLPFWR